MARILIVEDESEMAQGLKDNFEFDGHTVKVKSDGESGLQTASTEPFDLIILDLMLPQKSGFEVCKELRAQSNHTPIIMLTARGQEVDKVRGLEMGADDYITKPFSVRELLARMKAVLRRSAQDTNSEDDYVSVGNIQFDFDHYIAKTDEKVIELTHKESELLRYLLKNPGRVIPRDEILEKVWGYEKYPTTRTIDNYIVRLRKLIEKDPTRPSHILTVHGIGYKFIR